MARRLALLSLPTLLLGVFLAFYWRLSNPATEHPALPSGLIALDSAEGEVLRARAESADLAPLLAAFQVQEKGSWCGVASQAIVLSVARGRPVAQDEVFSPEAEQVRSWWRVTFGGMKLEDLGGMLTANGLRAEVHFASDTPVEAMRGLLRENLERPGDWVVVNYERSTLGQGSGGHISPVGAYDPQTDRFLVLDVAAYKWPPVWVTAARR